MRLSKKDRFVLDSVRRALEVLNEGAPSAIVDAVEPISELIGAHMTGIYSLSERTGGFEVSFCETRGASPVFRAEMDRFFRAAPDDFALYRAIRPEARDRNVLVDWPSIEPRYRASDPPPIVTDFMDRVGLKVEEQMRILLCEGPSLLAWFGGFFHQPPGPRERLLFQALSEPLRLRLAVDRSFARVPLLSAALAESMEIIATEAFIVHASGYAVHMNSAGQAWFDKSPISAQAAFRDAIVARAKSTRFSVRELQMAQGPRYFLLTAKQPNSLAQAEAFGARIGLTKRERDVIAFLIQGASNARIGAELEISDRTVESHVESILKKADVGSRASLIALIAGMG